MDVKETSNSSTPQFFYLHAKVQKKKNRSTQQAEVGTVDEV